jgi:hypothetical protein
MAAFHQLLELKLMLGGAATVATFATERGIIPEFDEEG